MTIAATAPVAMREAFGSALVSLAGEFPELVVLDADVSSSTRSVLFARQHPERFFNVGVAEANMVDIAAGLATCGLRPVVNTFALFLALRAGEQVRNTIAYNGLPVVLAGTYAGLSDSYDGASHQSIADIAVMRALPGMAVLVPADASEVEAALRIGLTREGPTYIRLGRNPMPVALGDRPMIFGLARKLREGADLTMAACGVPVAMAIEAAEMLRRECGLGVDLLAYSTIKPFDFPSLCESAARTGAVVTVEEHSVIGGLGSAAAEALSQHTPAPLTRIGVQDEFPESGDYPGLLAKHGLSPARIAACAREIVERKRRS